MPDGNVVQFSGANEREIKARKHTEAIRVTGEHFVDLVSEAYRDAMHFDLGYSSWQEYWTAEFGSAFKINLPTGERDEAIGRLREIGMSNREIATATGLSKDTVRRSTSGANDPYDDLAPDADEPADDGSDQAVSGSESDADELDDEIIEAEIVDGPAGTLDDLAEEGTGDEESYELPDGTQIIGKNDKPLTDLAIARVRPQITRLIKAIDKITIDKRYNKERRKIKAALRRDLDALRTCTDILET